MAVRKFKFLSMCEISTNEIEFIWPEISIPSVVKWKRKAPNRESSSLCKLNEGIPHTWYLNDLKVSVPSPALHHGKSGQQASLSYLQIIKGSWNK